MSTGGSLPERPSDDAAVVRYGRQEVTPGLIVAAFAWSVAADGLPRLRHRVELTNMANATPDVERACFRWVPPGLWHGNKWQPEGYEGRPDRAGHRRRLRANPRTPAQRTETPPSPHTTVPPEAPRDRIRSDRPG
ncbi:hypothetical protein [Streptomyces sp. NPDC058751]|uniref:hypothetical protein n=1 Tax=Streptomyces sp. NPDC058751 TaxID=3346623 RepID=UPI0036861310